MPYIKTERRESLFCLPDKAQNPGELNYIITLLLIDYLRRRGLSYQHINDCVGALECAKLELTRRVTAPYEDTKIVQNGDVYPAALTEESKIS